MNDKMKIQEICSLVAVILIAILTIVTVNCMGNTEVQPSPSPAIILPTSTPGTDVSIDVPDSESSTLIIKPSPMPTVTPKVVETEESITETDCGIIYQKNEVLDDGTTRSYPAQNIDTGCKNMSVAPVLDIRPGGK